MGGNTVARSSIATFIYCVAAPYTEVSQKLNRKEKGKRAFAVEERAQRNGYSFVANEPDVLLLSFPSLKSQVIHT